MTIHAGVALGILVLLAVLVGAFVAVVLNGGDGTALATMAAAGAALLGGLILADLVRRKGNGT